MEFNRGISVNFSEGELSGETGMLLIEEFCKGLGVRKLLGKYVQEMVILCTQNQRFCIKK